MMNQVMTQYDRLNPEAQQECLRLWLAVNTDDYDLAQRWVPDQPYISDSASWAQSMVGTIMENGDASVKPGYNIKEVIETWLHQYAKQIAAVEQVGGVTDQKTLTGLGNFSLHIKRAIARLAQDRTQKQQVKIYSDDLGNLDNLVKAYAQRLAESRQQQNGQSQLDPKDAAKIQATMLTAQTKSNIAKQSAAQRTAQRQIQFEQKVRQDAVEHRQKLAATDLEHAASIQRNRLASVDEGTEV